ncbi:hypothetical protein HYV84_04635 [Candidatus Woesearchaeota archaeon]|nr:hypothetical protein [Candidatus Woesearchaeota archaeon]
MKNLVRFTGTLEQNFLTCATKSTTDGRIFYDKAREPRHEFLEVLVADSLALAFSFALKAGNIVEGISIVLEGTVQDDPFGLKIPREIPFYVTRVWVPKKGIDPNKIYCTDERILEFVEPHDPLQYYKQKNPGQMPLGDPLVILGNPANIKRSPRGSGYATRMQTWVDGKK